MSLIIIYKTLSTKFCRVILLSLDKIPGKFHNISSYSSSFKKPVICTTKLPRSPLIWTISLAPAWAWTSVEVCRGGKHVMSALRLFLPCSCSSPLSSPPSAAAGCSKYGVWWGLGEKGPIIRLILQAVHPGQPWLTLGAPIMPVV